MKYKGDIWYILRTNLIVLSSNNNRPTPNRHILYEHCNIYLKKQRTLGSYLLYYRTRQHKTLLHTHKVYGLICSRAEYLLFLLIGAPGIYDSLNKLALLKQLVEKSAKKWNTTNSVCLQWSVSGLTNNNSYTKLSISLH